MAAKKTLAAALALLLATALLGCACVEGGGLDAGPTPPPKGLAGLSVAPSDFDRATGFMSFDTKITLHGDSVTVSGPGARVDGTLVTITGAGTYVVSGTLDDGQLAVKASGKEQVHVVLNGASITNRTGAAIYASQCHKLVVTLAEGTENTLTDGGQNFVYADEAEQEPNAALFCKDDLTINGSGRLTVRAGFKNGISTKDNLLILGGGIEVTAANHALYGKDSIAVLGGALALKAGSDGMQTNAAGDAARGWVLVAGGSVAIDAANDGIQADTALEVTGGTLAVTAGGGAQKSEETTGSFKGLKSGGTLSVTGGDVAIESAEDCLNAAGDMLLGGGVLSLSTAAKAAQSGGFLRVAGGAVAVARSFEGLEGVSVEISGGEISIVSGDDAINAAGGGPAPTGEVPSSGGCYVKVTGGAISFVAGGDGVDSNGDILISGGTMHAFISSTPDNGAMDCDGALTVTGGTLVYGGTGAGKTPGGASAQSYVFLTRALSKDAVVSVKKGGETLADVALAADCDYLVISMPGIAANESYALYSGEALLAEVIAGTAGEFLGGRGKGGG